MVWKGSNLRKNKRKTNKINRKNKYCKHLPK